MELSREEFNRLVGNRIKERRIQAGHKNLPEFARSLNVKADTYRKYEAGKVGLSLELAWSIADLLKCSLDELVGRDETENLRVIDNLDYMERDMIAKFRDMDAEGKIKTFNNFQYFIVSSEEGGSTEQ